MKYKIEFTIDVPSYEMQIVDKDHMAAWVKNQLKGMSSPLSNAFTHYEIAEFSPSDVKITKI